MQFYKGIETYGQMSRIDEEAEAMPPFAGSPRMLGRAMPYWRTIAIGHAEC